MEVGACAEFSLPMDWTGLGFADELQPSPSTNKAVEATVC